MPSFIIRATAVALLLAVSACGEEAGSSPESQSFPKLIVHKNETCLCCNEWVKHVKRHGFPVEVRNVDNLANIKGSVGIPAGMGSCHTAQVGRYFVEGHVPAADIQRLLQEMPDAKGLTVPAMPIGSPGMEDPSGKTQPYDVYLVANDGSVSVFAHHGPPDTP